MIPLIWLLAGVVLVAAEVVVGEFTLLMLGAAALVTAGASALGVPLGPDVVVFGLAAALLIGLARPALTRRLRVPNPVNTGTTGLLGSSAQVVEPIEPGDAAVGTVRIAGAVWTARSLHGADTFVAGTPVVVVEIRGATAVVSATDPQPTPSDRPETGGT